MEAHLDNHGMLAMEVLMTEAVDGGEVAHIEELGLLPTLETVKAYLAGVRAAESAGTRTRKSPTTDTPSPTDHTLFQGIGTTVSKYTSGKAQRAANALGFFLYTQCKGNVRGEWPPTTCATSCLAAPCVIANYLKRYLRCG